MNGRYNIAGGFWVMGLFMLYGFLLIWLRDFSKGTTIFENMHLGAKHFELRLAHVHGNLFAFLNIIIGFLLIQFKNQLCNIRKISALSLSGFLMPFGILSEIYFGIPPVAVLIGATSMTIAVIWLGIEFFRLKNHEPKN